MTELGKISRPPSSMDLALEQQARLHIFSQMWSGIDKHFLEYRWPREKVYIARVWGKWEKRVHWTLWLFHEGRLIGCLCFIDRPQSVIHVPSLSHPLPQPLNSFRWSRFSSFTLKFFSSNLSLAHPSTLSRSAPLSSSHCRTLMRKRGLGSIFREFTVR
jgi:hypothetical protein